MHCKEDKMSVGCRFWSVARDRRRRPEPHAGDRPTDRPTDRLSPLTILRYAMRHWFVVFQCLASEVVIVPPLPPI